MINIIEVYHHKIMKWNIEQLYHNHLIIFHLPTLKILLLLDINSLLCSRHTWTIIIWLVLRNLIKIIEFKTCKRTFNLQWVITQMPIQVNIITMKTKVKWDSLRFFKGTLQNKLRMKRRITIYHQVHFQTIPKLRT